MTNMMSPEEIAEMSEDCQCSCKELEQLRADISQAYDLRDKAEGRYCTALGEIDRLRNIVTGCPVCSELERNIQPANEPEPVVTNEMVERLTGSLWMVTKPGTDMNCLGRVYRDKGTAFTHKDYDETVVELRLADAHEPLPVASFLEQIKSWRNPYRTHYNDGFNYALNKVIELIEGASRDASPADLVGALQDVVHTDPGPVRAGKASRDASSKLHAKGCPCADCLNGPTRSNIEQLASRDASSEDGQ